MDERSRGTLKDRHRLIEGQLEPLPLQGKKSRVSMIPYTPLIGDLQRVRNATTKYNERRDICMILISLNDIQRNEHICILGLMANK